MGANEAQQSLSAIAAAEAFKHDQMLLRAIHKTQRVLHKGKPRYIQVLRCGPSGGSIETEVYLMGIPDAVPAREISLAPEST